MDDHTKDVLYQFSNMMTFKRDNQMKKIVLLICLMFSVSTYALDTPAGWNDLTPAQQAEINLSIVKKIEQVQVTKAAAETASTSTLKDSIPNAKEMDNYVILGQHIGQAFGGAAKEIGVQVNDFVNTPVGLLTILLIIWHFMGIMLIHIIFGLLTFILGLFMINKWYKQTIKTNEKFDPNLVDRFGRSRRVSITYDSDAPKYTVIAGISSGILLIVCLAIAFTW